jgi:hypothetical protein
MKPEPIAAEFQCFSFWIKVFGSPRTGTTTHTHSDLDLAHRNRKQYHKQALRAILIASRRDQEFTQSVRSKTNTNTIRTISLPIRFLFRQIGT